MQNSARLTEVSARDYLVETFNVSRETLERLELLESLVRAETQKQNLIARSTLEYFWTRHIVDSAQLLKFVAVDKNSHWLDLGTGAGFPGLVIAIMAPCKMTMVESRARRIGFLNDVVETLDIANRAKVAGCRLESLETEAAHVISARAFAPLPKLLSLSGRFSTDKTCWLLPKGRNAQAELETLPQKWQHMFHVEHSVTDENALILVGNGQYRAK